MNEILEDLPRIAFGVVAGGVIGGLVAFSVVLAAVL